ncbi:autotransporter outer membrane beta-barrel domain-containing protein [Piscinibacter aquaticus]|uniref:Autotransporter outer membrane beta-barrel domain-containing protein n=1 Tax=Piscinibacter aquaticus TaxID=392597 RepID=A0A5C6TZ75_9BURK|nr:autotransporter outer membrane beta-barrel domain-containing protein [Piscinibacter aquaticus]
MRHRHGRLDRRHRAARPHRRPGGQRRYALQQPGPHAGLGCGARAGPARRLRLRPRFRAQPHRRQRCHAHGGASREHFGLRDWRTPLGLRLSAAVGQGSTTITTQRAISGDSLSVTGERRARQSFAAIAGSAKWSFGRWHFGPQLVLEHQRARLGAYTETGLSRWRWPMTTRR